MSLIEYIDSCYYLVLETLTHQILISIEQDT